VSPGNAGITPLIGSDTDSIFRAVQLLKIATLRYAHRLGAGDGRYYAITAQGSKELSEQTAAQAMRQYHNAVGIFGVR
jgi:hypothetical protein